MKRTPILLGLAIAGLAVFFLTQRPAPRTAEQLFRDRFDEKFGAGFPFD